MRIRMWSASAFLLLLPSASPRAQWLSNGNIVCDAAESQVNPQLVSGDPLGTIVIWLDGRGGAGTWDIYAQKLDALGTRVWITNGVPVIVGPGNQQSVSCASDGAGGAIVAWTTDSLQGILARRIGPAGSGTVVITGANNCQNPSLISDGAGGAFIAWADFRNGNLDIFAQHLSGGGESSWAYGGTAVCTTPAYQNTARIVTDGAGGVIVAWLDDRNATFGRGSAYAQRLNASGAALWTTDGVPLNDLPTIDGVGSLVLISDGKGGGIAAWGDYRNGRDIYAQRVRPDGTTAWSSSGETVCTDPNDQETPELTSDMNGGAIVAWADYRAYPEIDVYAQRIDSLGVLRWTPDGVPVCDADSTQYQPQVVSDASGGAIMTWVDYRNKNSDIFAARADASGNMLWTPNGIAVCSEIKGQGIYATRANGSGGAVVAWTDYRNGVPDIYASSITPSGALVTAVHDTPSAASAVLTPNSPNPFSDRTGMDLTLARRSSVLVTVFDVSGRVLRREARDMRAGTHHLEFHGIDGSERPLPSGVYFYRVITNGETITRKMVIAR